MTPIQIGRHTLRNSGLLAPMTGVSDLPLRRLAHRLGAGLAVSEMVVSAESAREQPDILRRAEGSDVTPHVIQLVTQLVGCEPSWMAEAARIAVENSNRILAGLDAFYDEAVERAAA